MGRKAMHNQEQIFQAANRLVAEGQEVTPTALRTALGGGSLTTIYKHLAAWEASRQPTHKPAATALPDAVQKIFVQAWQIAAAEANRDIAAIREKSEAATQHITHKFEEALKSIAQLEAEAEADAAELEKLQADLAARLAEMAVLKTEAAAREAALIASNQQLQQHIERQQTECDVLRQENKTLISARAKLQGQLETLQAQAKEQGALLAKILPVSA